jgi:hypothetical protein
MFSVAQRLTSPSPVHIMGAEYFAAQSEEASSVGGFCSEDEGS